MKKDSRNSHAADVPAELRRSEPPRLPEVPEFELVRHFTELSTRNFGVDTGFYPLGSCTMKYNPRVNERLVDGSLEKIIESASVCALGSFTTIAVLVSATLMLVETSAIVRITSAVRGTALDTLIVCVAAEKPEAAVLN